MTRSADRDQDRILRQPIDARLIVEAGPGYGKTDVAAARVASFLRHGAGEGEILLLTFTRTAVREIRDRIAALAKQGVDPRAVEIRTIDSFAWQLRRGLLEPGARVAGSRHEQNFEVLVAALAPPGRSAQRAQVMEHLDRKRHIIVDEAQDLVGVRATFIELLLSALPDQCGWTVFVDPAQAIYDWVESDSGSDGASFLDSIERLSRNADRVQLKTLHRTSDPRLKRLLKSARTIVLDDGSDASCEQLRELLMDESVAEQVASRSLAAVAASPLNENTRFVLFRRRGDALMLSGELAKSGCRHQLRIGHLATATPPWIAAVSSHLPADRWSESSFFEAWQTIAANNRFLVTGWTAESAWKSLRSIAAQGRTNVSLPRIADAVALGYLPDELVRREIGASGPVIGTIHAAKGREADEVFLVVPRSNARDDDSEDEARVMYVGLSRPRQKLAVAEGTGKSIFSYNDPERAWRYVRKSGNIQIEVGREGDVHRGSSILAVPDAGRTQELLLHFDGTPTAVYARKVAGDPELRGRGNSYRFDLFLADEEDGPQLGSLGAQFDQAVFEAGRKYWRRGPKFLKHAYLFDVRSSSLPDDDPALARMPEPWRSRRLWLSPMVAGLFVAFKPR